MQDVYIVLAIAASFLAVLSAAMLIQRAWGSMWHEVWALFVSATSKEIERDLDDDNEKGGNQLVAGEAHEAVNATPADPPQQRPRITLRRLLWGVKPKDGQQGTS
jgi:hypothetical protein